MGECELENLQYFSLVRPTSKVDGNSDLLIFEYFTLNGL